MHQSAGKVQTLLTLLALQPLLILQILQTRFTVCSCKQQRQKITSEGKRPQWRHHHPLHPPEDPWPQIYQSPPE